MTLDTEEKVAFSQEDILHLECIGKQVKFQGCCYKVPQIVWLTDRGANLSPNPARSGPKKGVSRAHSPIILEEMSLYFLWFAGILGNSWLLAEALKSLPPSLKNIALS